MSATKIIYDFAETPFYRHTLKEYDGRFIHWPGEDHERLVGYEFMNRTTRISIVPKKLTTDSKIVFNVYFYDTIKDEPARPTLKKLEYSQMVDEIRKVL